MVEGSLAMPDLHDRCRICGGVGGTFEILVLEFGAWLQFGICGPTDSFG